MHDILQRGDRTDIASVIHDDGIERDVAIAVRIPTQTHGVICWIGFRDARTRFHGIEE
jgi:hypothetical protein